MAGIVDLRGREVADLKVKGSSLVKARQWMEYLDAWAETFSQGEPWQLFMLHATLNLHQGFVVMSRRLRKNRAFTGGATMAEDTIGLLADASGRLAWFEKSSEQIDQRGLPEWAKFQFASIEGALRMQVRLAGECEQVLRKGHLLIAVDSQGRVLADSNEERPDAPGAEREV